MVRRHRLAWAGSSRQAVLVHPAKVLKLVWRLLGSALAAAVRYGQRPRSAWRLQAAYIDILVSEGSALVRWTLHGTQ